MENAVLAVMDGRLASLLEAWSRAMSVAGWIDAPLAEFSDHADHLIVINVANGQFHYTHYGKAFAQEFGLDLSGHTIDLLPTEILPIKRRLMLEFEYNFVRSAGRPLWRSYTAPFEGGYSMTWQRLVLPNGPDRLITSAYPVPSMPSEKESEAASLLRLVIERVPVVLDASGCVNDLVLSLKTFTDAQQHVAELETLAALDALTEVANLRHFHRLASLELDHARRMVRPFSVLMLDLDHFKLVNDRFGHAAGNQALKLFADICRGALRDGDILGRVGGEEFAITLPNTNVEGALRTAERLRAQVEAARLDLPDGQQLSLTVSIGVMSCIPGHRQTDIGDNSPLTQLMACADTALYRAKGGGRNRVMIYEAEAESLG